MTAQVFPAIASAAASMTACGRWEAQATTTIRREVAVRIRQGAVIAGIGVAIGGAGEAITRRGNSSRSEP